MAPPRTRACIHRARCMNQAHGCSLGLASVHNCCRAVTGALMPSCGTRAVTGFSQSATPLASWDGARRCTIMLHTSRATPIWRGASILARSDRGTHGQAWFLLARHCSCCICSTVRLAACAHAMADAPYPAHAGILQSCCTASRQMVRLLTSRQPLSNRPHLSAHLEARKDALPGVCMAVDVLGTVCASLEAQTHVRLRPLCIISDVLFSMWLGCPGQLGGSVSPLASTFVFTACGRQHTIAVRPVCVCVLNAGCAHRAVCV